MKMNGTATHLLALVLALSASATSLGCATTTEHIVTRVVPSGSPAPTKIADALTITLPDEVQGRMYQAQVLPGPRPLVLVTTGQHVLLLGEKPDFVLFSLERKGAIGETAVLPSPWGLRPRPDARIGVLVHRNHAVERFRLVDLGGRTLVNLDDSRHFHYRISPDGSSFVGIDNGGAHTGLTAKTVTYRFFSDSGKTIGEVRASDPRSPDSAYDPFTARRLWSIPKEIKFFAASNREPGRVIISDAKIRDVAELYEAGRRQWQVNLHDFGSRENVRNVAISPNGQYTVVSGATLLLILGVADPKPLGILQIREAYSINSVSVTNQGVVAVGVHEARPGDKPPSLGRVFVLDGNGNILFEQGTEHQRTNAWIPAVQFDATGRSLLIETLESVRVLTLQ